MDNLARLAAKPGVQATLVLSKADGSIIRSSGLLAPPSPPASGNGLTDGDVKEPIETLNGDSDYNGISGRDNKGKNVEDVAKMVFLFVSAAGDFAQGMDDGDEVKLLRLRTRKNEIVIVPGKLLFSLRTVKSGNNKG